MNGMGAMGSDGTHGYGQPVPPVPPGKPSVPSEPRADSTSRPPVPRQAPPMSEVERWLRTPRTADAPGVYAYGHVVRKHEDDEVSDGRVIGRAVLALLLGLLVWSLRNNGYLPWIDAPLRWLSPSISLHGGHPNRRDAFTLSLFSLLWTALVAYGAWRYGNWSEAGRRFFGTPAGRAWFALALGILVWELSWNGYVPILGAVLALVPPQWIRGGGNEYAAAVVTYGVYAAVAALIAWPCAKYGGWLELVRQGPRRGAGQSPAPPTSLAVVPEPFAAPPADWPELRAAGCFDAADRLTREVAMGRVNDVDCVRIRHAWNEARDRPGGVTEFTSAVMRLGGAAFVHPSGERDLPGREGAVRHDLLVGQVRIGHGLDDERNGDRYRGSGMALDQALLGTGLLVVGPPGAGKTRRVMRPLAESLCLQALTGTAAVVAVAGADTDLGPGDAYDVVVSPGNPASRYCLDLYGGTNDPDVAAGLLAEALIDGPEAEQRRAATALGQLLGPYSAVHGHFPAVPVLRELLDGVPDVHAELRQSVDAAGAPAHLRELDARQRQSARPGDIGALLADRIALLDRPAFAESFGGPGRARPFSMEALAHPIRVRIELPEQAHVEASRIIVRLLLAQFTAAVRTRRPRSRFACLIVDDAGHAVTAQTVRALSSLPSARAGVALGLRTLDDVPESLRGPLVSAAGCRMAMAGVTPRDGAVFSESWGTTRVETREVTSADRSGGVSKQVSRALRRAITHQVLAADSVTVREVERERWSASDLAHTLPAGHAVLSLTTVYREHAAPVLLDLRG